MPHKWTVHNVRALHARSRILTKADKVVNFMVCMFYRSKRERERENVEAESLKGKEEPRT